MRLTKPIVAVPASRTLSRRPVGSELGSRRLARLGMCVMVGACLAMAAIADAHDVVEEQIVQIVMRITGDRLSVNMRIPVAVLSDPALPRRSDGTLDLSAIAEPVRIVAGDAARNLDVRQNGASVPQMSFASRLSPDAVSIEVDATYSTSGATGISARLNTFADRPLRPVRTAVDYVAASGQTLKVSVTGQPSRVEFEPSVSTTLARFARTTLRSLVGLGDPFLLLVCLLLPVRSLREAVRLVAVMAAGQAIGMLSYVAWPGGLASISVAAALLAASAIVVASIQVIVRARTMVVGSLAAVFGVLFGMGLGRELVADIQMSGTHHSLAVLTTFVTVVVAQLWAGVAIWAARSWLDDRGVPAYALGAFVAVLVAHTGIHHLMASAQSNSARGSFLADHTLGLVVFAWGVVILAIAGVDLLRGESVSDHSTPAPRQALS